MTESYNFATILIRIRIIKEISESPLHQMTTPSLHSPMSFLNLHLWLLWWSIKRNQKILFGSIRSISYVLPIQNHQQLLHSSGVSLSHVRMPFFIRLINNAFNLELLFLYQDVPNLHQPQNYTIFQFQTVKSSIQKFHGLSFTYHK